VRIGRATQPPKLKNFLVCGEARRFLRVTDFRQYKRSDDEPASRGWIARDEPSF
jgi:hypothetical protein